MISQPSKLDRSTAEATVVFISYSRKDLPWIKDYLLPLLDAAGVRYIIDERDFEIGPNLEETIQAKIAEATHVVLVMTPHSVSTKWPHLESVWAADKIWPIKLRPCDVPPSIGARVYLDLCDIRSRDKKIVKLLKDVGASETGIAEALNRVAKKTWALLVELMEEPKIQENLCDLHELFTEIQESNEVLSAIKSLHDCLQDLQQDLFQCPVFDHSANEGWDKRLRWSRGLRKNVADLESCAESLRDVNVRFVKDFKGLPERLKDAARKQDQNVFEYAYKQISKLVDRGLVVTNYCIVDHIEKWKVTRLEAALQSLYEYVDEYDYDPLTKGTLDQLQARIQTLSGLHESVRQMVDDHSVLQGADLDLQFKARENLSLFDVTSCWADISMWVSELQLRDRYSDVLKYFDRIDGLLGEQETVRDDAFEDDVVRTFEDFVDETNYAFNRLDIDLKKLCKKLNPHSTELKKILDRMQAYESET